MKLPELHLHTLPRYMTDMLGKIKIARLKRLHRIEGRLRGLGRGRAVVVRKLICALVAVLFVTSMSLVVAAHPAGSIGSSAAGTVAPQNGAVAMKNAGHHTDKNSQHNNHDIDDLGAAEHVDHDCTKDGGSTHKHPDRSGACCSSACHIAAPIDAQLLAVMIVHMINVGRVVEPVRTIDVTQLERPPRSAELQLG